MLEGVENADLGDGVVAAWGVPLSGYGVTADEQPLPYVCDEGRELTPRYGGEAGCVGTGVDTLPLPSGVLSQRWPARQRLFNLARRRVNLYWRNLFRSCCSTDGTFHFVEQLTFGEAASGFRGRSPIVEFSRVFTFGRLEIRVADRIRFRRPLHFSVFHPVVVALFPECEVRLNGATVTPGQTVDDAGTGATFECAGFDLSPQGEVVSSTGRATLWKETVENVSFHRGDEVQRHYSFAFARRRADSNEIRAVRNSRALERCSSIGGRT